MIGHSLSALCSISSKNSFIPGILRFISYLRKAVSLIRAAPKEGNLLSRGIDVFFVNQFFIAILCNPEGSQYIAFQISSISIKISSGFTFVGP